VENELAQYPGVTSAEVGYTGGHTNNPTYEQVCSENTGHAEAVKITFDPHKTSYKAVIKLFLDRHAPSISATASHDGQYRTAIFYQSADQRMEAKQAVAEFEAQTKRSAATALEPAGHFWRAEDYHQDYYKKHGLGVCRI
jgi:methionine-S-sulfoxide reductase